MIVVTGATGQLGRLTLHHLLKTVRVLTPTSQTLYQKSTDQCSAQGTGPARVDTSETSGQTA